MRFIRVSVAYPGDWRAGDLLGALSSTEPTPTDGLEPWPVEMGPVLGPRFRWFLDAHCHHLNLPRAFLERGETYRVAYAAPSGHLLVGESVQGITISVELAPYMTTSWREMILVGFEDACLEVHLPPPLAQVPGRVRVYREHRRMPPEPGATWEEPGVPYRFSLGEQARTFLSVVRGEAPPPVDAAEALEDIRTAYAYFRAPVDREVVDNRGMFAVPPAAGK